MIRQALLFLADVEPFDVVDEFLLQPILVVFDLGNAVQSLDDALADFLHALLLESLDAGEQLPDVIDFLGEFPFERCPFLTAEVGERVEGLLHGLAHHRPFLLAEHFGLGARRHVGHPHQRLKPVLRLGNAHRRSHLLHLPIIILHERGVDFGRVAAVFFGRDDELHFSALQLLRNHLADFHFLLAIERHDTRHQVELLGIERLHLYADFLLSKGCDSLAVTRH